MARGVESLPGGSTSQLTLGRSPRRGCAAVSWDEFENLSGAGWADGMPRAHLEVHRAVARGASPTGILTPARGCYLLSLPRVGRALMSVNREGIA